jgi:hypothetical protein
LSGPSGRACADELGSLLGPDAAAAGEDPRRPSERVVGRPADDRGIAIGGQRDRVTLEGFSRVGNSTSADQLRSLLGPDGATAGEDPGRPNVRIVRRADDHGIAVGGQRDGPALTAIESAGADQLGSLLGPDAAAAGEHPRCPHTGIVRPAQDGGIAVAGQRDGVALVSGKHYGDRAGADELRPLLRQLRQCRLRCRKQRRDNQRSDVADSRGPVWPRCQRGSLMAGRRAR